MFRDERHLHKQLAAWQAQQRLDGHAAHWLLLLTEEKSPNTVTTHAASSSPVLLNHVSKGRDASIARPVTQLCCEALTCAPCVVGTQTTCPPTTTRLPRHSRVWRDMRPGDTLAQYPSAVVGSRARRLLALLGSAVAAWLPVVVACALAETNHVCVVVGMSVALGTAIIDLITAYSLYLGGLCKVWIRPWQVISAVTYCVLLLTAHIPRSQRVGVWWFYPISLAVLLLVVAASIIARIPLTQPLLTNHIPRYAQHHPLTRAFSHTLALLWTASLGMLLSLGLTRAIQIHTLHGWGLVMVGYGMPMGLMVWTLWATVQAGMQLQQALSVSVLDAAVGENAIVQGESKSVCVAGEQQRGVGQQQQRGGSVPAATPPKTPQREGASPNNRTGQLRQAVARCEAAEARAQQAIVRCEAAEARAQQAVALVCMLLLERERRK